MNVIALHRKVQDAKPLSRRRPQRPTHFEKQRLPPQARQPTGSAKRDMNGIPPLMFRARNVRNARPLSERLPPGPVAPPTPRKKDELPLRRRPPSFPCRRASDLHLDSAIVSMERVAE